MDTPSEVTLALDCRRCSLYSWRTLVLASLVFLMFESSVRGGGLDVVIEYSANAVFSDEQRTLLDPAFSRAEKFWESVILGRVGEEGLLQYPIEIRSTSTGIASATAQGVTRSGDLFVGTSGTVWVNPAQIVPAINGFNIEPGVDVLDELLAHEIAHALGMGSLWRINDLVETGSGQYTGEFGLAAYRDEYQINSEFVPVELAGGTSSANVHWNQLFRSSIQEGNPDDPLSLSPLIGIVDNRGRDLGQEIMSPAVDPDFGEPHFSNTTIQAFRDLGYEVVDSFSTSLCDFDQSGACDAIDIDAISQRVRDAEFEQRFDLFQDNVIDELDRSLLLDWHMDRLLGDADFSDDVDFADFLILSANFGGVGGWAQGDFDGDGAVGFADFLLLSDRFGQANGHSAVSVPEPSGRLSLLLFWLCFFVARKALK